MPFEKVAEQKILEAIERGEFDNLSGEGKPLQGLDAYFATPEQVRMGYSILKSAGVIPEEVSLLKEIESLKERLKSCSDEATRTRIDCEIQALRLKYDLIVEHLRRTPRSG
jgi:hypothetical protein